MSQTQSPHVLGTSALLKALLLSVTIAAIVLLTVILPAEYNIDPTGIGERLGLTVLSGAQAATVTAEPEAVKAEVETPAEQTQSSDVIDVSVPARSGVEYKLNMDQFEKLTYKWKTDGPALYFDLHGEPRGDTTGYYESYAIAELAEMEGSFTTPFDGTHGWYWKNNTDQPVVVTVNFTGKYTINGLKP